MKEYKAIIIGFGKGGKTLAAELANRGLKVAIVERSEIMYGGTCINIGCIPTKTLVHQAIDAEILNLPSFDEKSNFYTQAIDYKNTLTANLRAKNYDKLASHTNIDIYTGEASFLSSTEINVKEKSGVDKILTAQYIFINTGAETVIPAIKGIENNPYVYTSTSMLNLRELPQDLVIIGGGYIGLEFASMYSSFGTKVTVLDNNADLIPREDRDIANAIRIAMENKGINFKFNANIESINKHDNKAIASYKIGDENIQISADAILLATGRKPNTSKLNLYKAGVNIDDRGAVIVDENLRTNIPNIYAIGDVKGGLQFTYISLDDYRIIVDTLFGDNKRKLSDRNPISYSVFINPPLARVGMNEDEAKVQSYNYRVNKINLSAIPRALTINKQIGVFKAIIDNDTNDILGCVLFGEEAHEIINIVTLAIKSGLKANYLRDFIYTHPSMSEAFNELFG